MRASPTDFRSLWQRGATPSATARATTLVSSSLPFTFLSAHYSLLALHQQHSLPTSTTTTLPPSSPASTTTSSRSLLYACCYVSRPVFSYHLICHGTTIVYDRPETPAFLGYTSVPSDSDPVFLAITGPSISIDRHSFVVGQNSRNSIRC